MGAHKGGPKTPGSGRKKGTPNKATEEVARLLKELRFNPIRRAVALYNLTEDDSVKERILGRLMKHRYPELKSVEVQADVTHWTPELIASLSDSQRRLFMESYEKAHNLAPGIELLEAPKPEQNGTVWP